jgi:hypothetical protein
MCVFYCQAINLGRKEWIYSVLDTVSLDHRGLTGVREDSDGLFSLQTRSMFTQPNCPSKRSSGRRISKYVALLGPCTVFHLDSEFR